MNKQEIQQVVESYIKNENARYALLISGAWGCGKTFLYENYLADAISALEVGKNNRKTNIYISLYGMNSIEALSKQLLSNYLIYAKANGNDIVRKGVKAVSGILGAASRAFSFSAGAVSMDLEKLNELSTTIEVKDLVICFDDLERCSISISEVFGYINNLIEHCNCKVIILADEDNIGKTYANINVEQKYQTILTGGRKVIRDKPEDKTKRTDLATDELTMKELKQLNETLYSENYIYSKIKEAVTNSTYCIAVINQEFLTRSWPLEELNLFHSKEKKDQTIIIPVYVDIDKNIVYEKIPWLEGRAFEKIDIKHFADNDRIEIICRIVGRYYKDRILELNPNKLEYSSLYKYSFPCKESLLTLLERREYFLYDFRIATIELCNITGVVNAVYSALTSKPNKYMSISNNLSNILRGFCFNPNYEPTYNIYISILYSLHVILEELKILLDS